MGFSRGVVQLQGRRIDKRFLQGVDGDCHRFQLSKPFFRDPGLQTRRQERVPKRPNDFRLKRINGGQLLLSLAQIAQQIEAVLGGFVTMEQFFCQNCGAGEVFECTIYAVVTIDRHHYGFSRL